MTRIQVMAMLLGLAALSCARFGCSTNERPSPPDQRQPLTAPSGRYVLTVPITRGDAEGADPVWSVTIAEPGGAVVYQDHDSSFLGFFNVYWCWDADDRVWLYNSDDGLVWYWESVERGWNLEQWSPEQEDPRPPDCVYPTTRPRP